MISVCLFCNRSHAVSTKQYWPLLIRERVFKCCNVTFLLHVKYITYLNLPMVNPFRLIELVNLAGGRGRGVGCLYFSFILNYCLSHLLPSVD